jgi:hypothetical protein
MILLTSTSDILQIVTGSALTLDVHASWVDNASGVITPGRTNTEITTAATTTVVASPAASTQRNVQTLLINNLGVSANQVTINHFDGTVTVTLFNISLLAGYSIQFVDGVGFTVFNTTGASLGSGTQGATGATGAQGATSPSMMMGENGEDGDSYFGLTTGAVNRSTLAPNAKNWAFLGRAKLAAGATIVGPVVWTGQYANLYFEYVVTGYAGAAIGRVLCGPAAPSTSALTNTARVIEVTGVTTLAGTAVLGTVFGSAATNQPGIPLAAVTPATNVARSGVGWLWGDSGSLKTIKIEGTNATTATIALGATPSTTIGSSYFSDLGTNLPIQQMQLTSYTARDGVTIGSAFNTGTYLTVWGRNND